MKRYKFQALVTLAPPRGRGPAVPTEQTRRMVVRARHRETGASTFFNALVRRSDGTPSWPDGKHVIVTVVLVGDNPRKYFDIGDKFALWLGRDVGSGVVTRRLFI